MIHKLPAGAAQQHRVERSSSLPAIDVSHPCSHLNVGVYCNTDTIVGQRLICIENVYVFHIYFRLNYITTTIISKRFIYNYNFKIFYSFNMIMDDVPLTFIVC